jgi:hypothetical protein
LESDAATRFIQAGEKSKFDHHRRSGQESPAPEGYLNRHRHYAD